MTARLPPLRLHGRLLGVSGPYSPHPRHQGPCVGSRGQLPARRGTVREEGRSWENNPLQEWALRPP
eukprot:8375658-Pyramimonas_sp.AAC.1